MATPYRYLVTPADVIAYTENSKVKKRTSDKLSKDIMKAQEKVFSICNNRFPENEYATIPDEVSLAIIMYSEWYAIIAILANTAGYKSENLDDYSYSRESKVPEPDVFTLIQNYIKTTSDSPIRNNIGMRLSAI